MKKLRILWTDDEIEHLKAHIIFLEEKGYELETANNADDAMELLGRDSFDLVFLDENMPGKGGLDVLPLIKNLYPDLPVVMITKSEEENIMEEAIGSQIDDYLIKPVNPKQILLSIKKLTDQKKLVSEKTLSSYQTEFSKLGMLIGEAAGIEDWKEIYRKLIYWELELEKSGTGGMEEVLKMQHTEANHEFSKFIKRNYIKWFREGEESPLLSPSLMRKKIFPMLEEGEKVIFILVDNLRFDQWKILAPLLSEYYHIEEDMLCSILPTATQYARNSIFSGLMPVEIQKRYPHWWFNDDEQEGKNQFESELLGEQLRSSGLDVKYHYDKITNPAAGKKLLENLNNILNNDLIAIVYNFVDMLSHARTDSNMIRELAPDEKAYRDLTESWFRNSYLMEVINRLAEQNVKLVITTDHGTIRVQDPVKVIGDKHTSVNLRYKTGRSLNYKASDVFEIREPVEVGLPRVNMSSRYVFATDNDFLVYPNNYNHYVKYYRDTFQHGGVSMQEMLIPLIVLNPKKGRS